MMAGGFFALIFAVYASSLDHPFVRWDDGLLIYENPAIRAINFQTLKTIFTSYDPELYIPLTFLTYQIDFLIGGINPVIYHLQNLLFHTGNALLTSWFVWLLTRRPWMAVLCGLLFAVHPLHTEAVAWASARKDVVSTLFFLLSLNAFLLYSEQKQKRWYLLSIAAFLLALLAKVTVILLPFILLLIDMRNRRKVTVRLILEKAPYVLLSIIFGIIALNGKSGVSGLSTTAEKIIMAFKSTFFYLQKIAIPSNLSVLYPYTGRVSALHPDFLVPIAAIVAIALLALVSLRRTRDIAFGFGFFLLAIAPTFANFAKGDHDFYFASDRYAYAGSIGIFFLFALFTGWLCDRTQRHDFRRAIITACIAIIPLFGFFAFRQSQTWSDTEALFRNVLEHYPDSHVAHANIGNVYRRQGDAARAIEEYTLALEIKEHPRTLGNLASAYRQNGDNALAISTFDRALALDPENIQAHTGLGILHAQNGDVAMAEEAYATAIALDPLRSMEAQLNLGALFAQQALYDRALEQYDRALAMDPYFPHAHYNRGIVLEKLNRAREAADAYRHAISFEPSFVAARINLGIILANRREFDESIEQFQEVLRYDPGNARAISALEQLNRQ